MQQFSHNAHPNATAAPPISLPSATAVPHRPLVRSFGRRAIEPVGSLSGLSGAAAGFGGIGDDPGPVVAFANGTFDFLRHLPSICRGFTCQWLVDPTRASAGRGLGQQGTI